MYQSISKGVAFRCTSAFKGGVCFG